MLYHLPLVLSFVGASMALPPLLKTGQLDTNVSSPQEIGTPTNQTEGQQPENSTLGGVYLCHDIDWMNCTYTIFPLNTCFDMNQVWNNTISSIGPDNGTMITVFTKSNCTGNATELTFPGRSDLIQMDGMNDQIVSVNVLPAPVNTSGNTSLV